MKAAKDPLWQRILGPVLVLVVLVGLPLGIEYATDKHAENKKIAELEEQARIDAAYTEGYDIGYAEGFDEGHTDGFDSRSQEVSDLEQDIRDLESQNKIVNANYNSIVWEYNFYHNNAVVVTAAAGVKYHQYGCGHTSGRDIYIYNIELAKAKGYTACADCWPSNDFGRLFS